MIILKRGFTLVEISAAIVVISILATLVTIGYTQAHKDSLRNLAQKELLGLKEAIVIARTKSDQTFMDITGSTYTAGGCFLDNPSNNLGLVAPRELPQTHVCWTDYVAVIEQLESITGKNLENIKDGDPYGNPYIIDENEMEFAWHLCRHDYIGLMEETGGTVWFPTSTDDYMNIQMFHPHCT